MNKVLIKDFISTKPVAGRKEMSLKELHQLMKKHSISHMPIVENNNRPVGLISERDVRAFYLSPDFNNIKAERIMNSNYLSFLESTPLQTVVNEMSAKNHCASVIECISDGQIGIFTVSDALKALDFIFKKFFKD